MKKIIAAFAAAIISVAAFAAAKDNDKAPIAMNRFVDNWFVSAGAGVNTILDNGYLGLTGLATDLAVGKWLTPAAGFRLGWHGLNNKAKDTSNGWFAGEDRFGYQFVHIDFMWDVLNTFRYNEKRIVSVIPMVQGGYILTSYDGKNYSEFGFGASIQVSARITSRLRAYAEATATFAREEAWRKAGTLICFPSLTAGLQVNIGKTGFDRREKIVVETVTKTVVADCGHDAIIAALRAEIERLKSAPADTAKKDLSVSYNVYFQLDKSNLLEKERYHLIDLIEAVPEGATLSLVGHADKETGTRRRNRVLSEERVNEVYKTLLELGFKGKISFEAKGDTANPFSGPIPKNRCVTISVSLPE